MGLLLCWLLCGQSCLIWWCLPTHSVVHLQHPLMFAQFHYCCTVVKYTTLSTLTNEADNPSSLPLPPSDPSKPPYVGLVLQFHGYTFDGLCTILHHTVCPVVGGQYKS